MAEYYWPSDLPDTPLLDSFVQSVPNNSIITSMEYGPPKTRRRTSSAMKSLRCVYVLARDHVRSEDGRSVDQKTLLEDFLEIVDGGSFWLPDPLNTAQYIKVRFSPASEQAAVELVPGSASNWEARCSFDIWPLVPPRPRHV